MMKVLGIEFGKLLRLSSIKFAVAVLIIFPILWAYAPGIFNTYGFFMVSAYQVPALSLLSSMEFLLPLLVAIVSAELLGLEMTYHTLPTILLRPVTRSQWLTAKLIVVVVFPFILLGLLFVISLLAGAPLGYSSFVGGTGLGAGGILGQGTMSAGAALSELIRAYVIAACSLIPIGLLAILFTVVFMNVAAGALATLGVLIVMQLLVVFPGLEPFLLSAQLSAYASPTALGWTFATLGLYCAVFAAFSVVLFERKDF